MARWEPSGLSFRGLEGFPPLLLLRAARALGVIAFVAGCCCLLHASFLLLRDGPSAFAYASGQVGAALPTLAAAPLFLLSATFNRLGSTWAGITFVVGLLVVTLVPSVAEGPLAPGWYAQPVLILLSSVFLGVAPGLAIGVAAAAIWLIAAHDGTSGAGWTNRELFVAAGFLGSGLLGALVHNVFRAGLAIERAQRRRLEERERMLSHAMRIETLGDLAGLVAHQLRNLFQVVSGHAELTEGASEVDRERHLATVRERLADGRRLLDQLMDLAHPQEGVAERHDLGALVEQIAVDLRSLLPAGVELRVRIAAAELPVLIDRSGLEHALLNLALNALHAIDGRGQLTLRAGRAIDRAVVRFSDDGPGIPQEDLARIFDPYYTTKPRGQGTGLGLATVQRFVEAAGGSINVDSEVGHGSEFTLTFPIAELAAVTDEVGRSRSRALE